MKDQTEYWEDLMFYWQDINFDIGLMIMGYFETYIKQRERKKQLNREYLINLIDVYYKDKHPTIKSKQNVRNVRDICIEKKNFNLIRKMLPHKIGASRDRMFVPWMTPIEKMHPYQIYIAGIVGVSDGLQVRFRCPYSFYLEICKKYGWTPSSLIKSWSGEERNIRSLMYLESEIVEV